MSKRSALVTGSSGFLGVNLCEELCEQGWDVYALRRTSSDTRDLDRLPVNQVIGDVLDLPGLKKVTPDGLDAVFHVAADVSMWKPLNKRQNAINIGGAENIVALIKAKSVKRLIHTSSIGYWGVPAGTLDETSVSNALSCGVNYYASKYRAEQAVHAAVRDGIDAVVMNPAQVVGPYDYRYLPNMFREAASGKMLMAPGGNTVCGHARDYAKAHIAAVDKGRTGERYILGGHRVTFMEMFTLMARLADAKPPLMVAPDALFDGLGYLFENLSKITKKEPLFTPEMVSVMKQRFDLDSSKAEQELGFTTCSVEQMFTETYKWAKQQSLL